MLQQSRHSHRYRLPLLNSLPARLVHTEHSALMLEGSTKIQSTSAKTCLAQGSWRNALLAQARLRMNQNRLRQFQHEVTA